MFRCSLLLTAALLAACAEEPIEPLSFDFPVVTEIPLPGRGEGERDFLLAQAPGGGGFLFTRMSANREMQLLFVENPMEPGALMTPFPGAKGDADAVFDPKGERVLFMSVDRHEDPSRTDFDLFEARWNHGKLSSLRQLDALNTEYDEVFPGIALDGTIVFGSPRPGSLGGQDLYEATPTAGGYTVRQLTEINSTASDNNPLIFPDGQTLIFYSGRPRGFGAVDLYVSRRLADGTWGEPVNLGPEVNTEEGEYAPSLSADGRVLFFARGPKVYGINLDAVPALAN